MSLSNHFEYKSYTYNLNENNLKYDIYTTISDSNKLAFNNLYKCVISNIDEIHNYLILKLIFVVYKLTDNNIEITKPLIVYNANSHLTHLND